MVVPGSQQVKAQAEAEGLDRIFSEAGAEWREAGCSMCIAMNGDQLAAGAVRRQHQQPQLRGAAGQRRTDVPRQPADRRRDRRQRRDHRPAHDDGGVRLMEPIKTFNGQIVALPINDTDTDQIIPARYLKVTDKAGLGQGAVLRLAL